MKRSILESYLGKRVEVKLFDGSVCKGYLHKTGEEQFKRDPNLYWQRNLYFVTAEKETMFSNSCLFRTSYVKSIKEINI